jgi:hypothetical protein
MKRGGRFLDALREIAAVAFDDDLTRSLAAMAHDLDAGIASVQQITDRLTPIRGALVGRLHRAIATPSLPVLRALWTIAQYESSNTLRPELERLAIAWRDADNDRQRRRVGAELRAWFAVHEGLFSSAALRGPF